jgi:hypothetical protein
VWSKDFEENEGVLLVFIEERLFSFLTGYKFFVFRKGRLVSAQFITCISNMDST